VTYNIPVRLDELWLPQGDKINTFSIEILPILSQGHNTRCFLVLFIPAVEHKSIAAPLLMPPTLPTADEKDREILRLRNDLGSTKLYLQSLLEERDVANQELVSANEEIQSSNEELQSINEELETAKEELQSTNEELQTVNEELYNRNEELAQTSNDLINLLNNITIPVLMLDAELRIRQFTPIAERMMNVRSADVGRPIGEIRLNLNLDNLEMLLSEVIDSLGTKELEVQDRAGRWHLLRARPYRTADNKIDGVVVVLVEIDQIRKSQQQLVEARDFAQAVIGGAQVPLVVLDRELAIKMINRAFSDLCVRSLSELEGRSFCDLAARQWNLTLLRPQLAALVEKIHEPAEFELEHETGGTNMQVLQVNARAMGDGSDRIVLLAIQNITVRKLAERLLRREKERLEGRVAVTELALDRTQEELRALAASLFDAQEEERRRVARELHDDLAQKVALLDLTTERIQQGLRTKSAEVGTQMDELRRQITQLAQDLRRIAYQLHPTILDDLGLGFALKQLCEEFGQRENLPVHFTSRSLPSVPVTIGGALYRITQEALRNVAKHAGKTEVDVTLTGARRTLRLKISDQGHGFEPGEARTRGGMGILNMEERVRLLGGRFILKAQPGKGVTLTVQVALPDNVPLKATTKDVGTKTP
jgi:two-component system CheB/CheR fusion protein